MAALGLTRDRGSCHKGRSGAGADVLTMAKT
jgi:hypothetical protein